MGRGQAVNRLVEGNGRILEQGNQIVANPLGIDVAGDFFEAQQGFDFAGKGKGAIAQVIVKGSHPKTVAGAKEGLFSLVPDGKGEVTDDICRTAISPFLISG